MDDVSSYFLQLRKNAIIKSFLGVDLEHVVIQLFVG